jgi:hypothetical protein
MAAMRAVLTAVCGLTIAASTWLGVMFIVIHRPGYERGLGVSALFVLQSLLAGAVINQWLRQPWWGVVTLVGAVALTWAGTSAVLANINGPHFEGYAVVIGALLTLQGVLTILQLITPLFSQSSKVHQFGN